MTDRDVLDRIAEAFRHEPRLGPGFKPSTMTLAADGTLTLAGEVDSIAAKKRALEIAARPAEVRAVADRLHVAPATRMSDHAIGARLKEMYSDEPSFGGFAIREVAPGGTAAVPAFRPVVVHPQPPRGRIDYEVRDGVVILNGEVPGLVSQRLAGVMAWWVPGVRDVVNGLVPTPPEEDGPIRIEEAVRVVLDRDPVVNHAQIRVGVRGRTVRLTGLARSPEEAGAAEDDAWCVLGVDEVVNEIESPG